MAEVRITEREARKNHHIETRHTTMPNGERRFRLMKGDGTGYIRTEIGDDGAWQESHYHERVRETYIVDQGWVAYAREAEGLPQISVHHPGDCFTTEPYIIHNIYMSSGAVIHTVKHCTTRGQDRKVNIRTTEFDAIVRDLTERDLWIRSRSCGGSIDTVIQEEYRHFDNLLWQVPAWASAIFALSLHALNDGFHNAIVRLQLPVIPMTSVLLGLMGLALLCFSFVLWRFRMHQYSFKRYRTPWYRSASTYTQLLITTEAAALACLSQLIAGVNIYVSLFSSLMMVAALSLVYEIALRRAGPGHKTSHSKRATSLAA